MKKPQSNEYVPAGLGWIPVLMYLSAMSSLMTVLLFYNVPSMEHLKHYTDEYMYYGLAIPSVLFLTWIGLLLFNVGKFCYDTYKWKKEGDL